MISVVGNEEKGNFYILATKQYGNKNYVVMNAKATNENIFTIYGELLNEQVIRTSYILNSTAAAGTATVTLKKLDCDIDGTAIRCGGVLKAGTKFELWGVDR